MSKKQVNEITAPSDDGTEARIQANGYLTIEDITKAPDVVAEELAVPEWGGKIVVRGLTKGQQQEARRKARRGDDIDPDILEMQMFIIGVAEPKMTENHFGMLRQKNVGVIENILRAILRMSNMDPEVLKKLRASFPDGQ